MDVFVTPQLAVPTANDAIEIVSRWLRRDVGMAVHAVTATFDPTTFDWQLPVELTQAAQGRLHDVICKEAQRWLHGRSNPGIPPPSFVPDT